MILIPIGLIVSFVVYILGFLGVVALLEVISKEISKLLPFLNSFSINYYLPIILVCSIILAISLNGFYVKTKGNEETKYYRKSWQQILEIIGLFIICIFLFNQHFHEIILSKKQISIAFFIGLSVIYIISFSYFSTTYASNYFDYICNTIVKIVKYICMVYIILAALSVYSLIIYLHDIVMINNLVLSVIYFGVLLLLTLIISGIFYHFLLDYKDKDEKFEIESIFWFIGSIVIIGFSPVYNTFINNKGLYSIYTILTVNIGILLVLSILKTIVVLLRKKT